MTITSTQAAGPAMPPGRLRGRSAAAVLGGLSNEVRKYLQNYLAGWRGVLIQMAVFPTAYLLLVFFMGRGHIPSGLLVSTLIGAVPLAFMHEQVNVSFWGYLGDIQAGVLEPVYLTPLPSWVLMLGRQTASIAGAVPGALAMYLGGLIAMQVRHVNAPLDPAILVPIAAVAAGIAGLALLLSGLTLVFKRIEIITETAMALPFIVSGAFIPLSQLPGWVTPLSRLLVPITPGIEAMRAILLQHRSLTNLPGWGLGWLLAQPILLLSLGVLLFRLLERLAMRRGTLGSY